MKSNDIKKEIDGLRTTLRRLRAENGCPWDRERTTEEIISYMIDEAYELLQAERAGDIRHMEEELGDVFFLVIFIHELMLEKESVSLAEIVSAVHQKIVSRHPHVFGDRKASNSGESILEWERIKKLEKNSDSRKPVLSSIPEGLPPLRHATSLQKKAAGVGFDWPDHRGVIEKIHEEIAELDEAIESGDRDLVKEEVGDIIFTVVNLARILNIDSESALATTSEKFKRRFGLMEEKILAEGRKIEDLPLDVLENYWQRSK